jgi:AraC family transcriptional regulator
MVLDPHATLAPDAPHGPLDAGQNFGAMTQRVASGGLLLNAADHVPGMRVPHHEHENAYLCVVLQGGFELIASSRTHDCVAGSVLAHPAGHQHGNRFHPALGRCVNLHVGSTWLAEDRALRDWLSDFRRVNLPPSHPALRRLAQEMVAGDEAAPLACASAAVELLATAMRSAAPRIAEPRWMARVIERLESDLAHAPALSELARDCGLHPSHLARAFRQSRGETLGDYVRRRRVEQAEAALARSDLPLAEIAAAAGFADQAHFTRVFRAHFGVAPGARRRAMQAAF